MQIRYRNGLYLLYLSILHLRYSPTLPTVDGPRYSLVNVLALLRALLDVGQVVRGHGVDERLQLLLLPRRVELRVDRAQGRLDYVQQVGQDVEHLSVGQDGVLQS